MKFPEWLYSLLPGDQGSLKLELVWREKSASSIAADVGVTVYEVPKDKCLVLSNATMRFSPGDAAGVVNRRRLIADPPAGTTRFDILDDETNGAAGQTVSNNWQGEVVLPPGWKVRVEAFFTGTLHANDTAAAEIFGYLIPRGTFG